MGWECYAPNLFLQPGLHSPVTVNRTYFVENFTGYCFYKF